MEEYRITGMSCAACSSRVEKAVSAVDGVTACSVSLLTNSMGVEGNAKPEAVITAVKAAGYGASLKHTAKSAESATEDELKDRESPILIKRLIVSLLFLFALMYVSMGHMAWGWKLPSALEEDHVAAGLLQLLLAAVIMVINQKFFVSGFRGLIHRAPNMDTLVSLGAMAAFGYSTYTLFAMSHAMSIGDTDGVLRYAGELYFESAGMILTLITLGKLLEAKAKGKTTDALRSLMKLTPQTATLLRDGKEIEVPISEVKIGDVFVVRPGENIPVDGIVIEGEGAVNEAILTGESLPADKSAGDRVFAATTNQSGFLKCETTRIGEDTTLSQIIRMMSEASATKAPIAKAADRVSGVFVPAVLGISLVTLAVWLVLGQSIGFALARAISVLVISCPCSLGLATPVAIMVGNGIGARNGILFKTAASLEHTGRVKTVVLDKTGTVTKGTPEVTDLIPTEGYSETDLLMLAAALERGSEHPLATAIRREADARGLDILKVRNFRALTGCGVSGTLGKKAVLAVNLKTALENAEISTDVLKQSDELANDGKTPLFFVEDGKLIGVIAVADVLKEESFDAIRELREMGLRVVMLTGDNEKTANAIARAAGLDEVIAGVLPNDKEAVIRRLQENGEKVTMVGDGINDAPALTRADVGIAIGAGADVAIDAADVVLVKSRLSDVPAAIRIGRNTLRNVRENLFWAFIYNIVGIPLAAGVWYSLKGWLLNPMFGAAAMSLSSFCVVMNALRLNLAKIRRPNIPLKEKGENDMQETLKIDGMMCPHCEARVKQALEAIPTVERAEVSHKSGSAVVTLTAATDRATFQKAIADAGYTLL